jgi:hypothetical protein
MVWLRKMTWLSGLFYLTYVRDEGDGNRRKTI